MKCCAPLSDEEGFSEYERLLGYSAREYERVTNYYTEHMSGYRRFGNGRCHRSATVRLPGAFGERWFCRKHAKVWREHNRIVERIRAIPCR